MAKIIQVGMADLKIARSPDRLMTAGLGSCIGICIFDRSLKLGSLAHIMLPSSLQAKNPENKAKFADSAIEVVLDMMLQMVLAVIVCKLRLLAELRCLNFPEKAIL